MNELNKFNFFKTKALYFFNRGNIEEALNHVYIASTIAWNKMLSINNGIWYDDEMENLLFEAGRAILKDKNFFYKKRIKSKLKAVYIASHLYDTGGHSRVLKEWVRLLSDYFSEQYVYITNVMNMPTDAPYIIERLKKSGAIIKELSCEDGYIERIKRLSRWINSDSPDVIILFIHPNDVISTSLLLSLKNLPYVIFFNHADHSFWLGRNLADLFVEFRVEGIRISKEFRKIEENRLELVPPTSEISLKKKEKNIFQIPESATLSISIGNFGKVQGDPELNWFETITKLLQLSPGHYHLFITIPPPEDVLHRYIPEDMDIKKRFIIKGPFADLSPVYGAADFLIETFPLAGGTVRIEAMACKLPIVAFQNKKNPLLTRMDEILPSDYPFLAFDGEQVIDYSLRFIKNPELRLKIGDYLYEHYKKNFSPEKIREKLINIIKKIKCFSRDFPKKGMETQTLTSDQFERLIDNLNKTDSLSIVIVTFNSSKDLQDCLNSILSFTSLPFEIIIVDNDSDDRTREILESYRKKFPFFIRLIFNDRNMGFSRAYNQGIRVALGKYIVLLNPDTAVTPDWDKRMVAHFKEEDIAAVGPISNYAYGPQNLDSYLKELSLPNGNFEITHLSEVIYNSFKGEHIETRLLIGFCIMTKREVFNKIGMLDDSLFLGNDDLEFSWRLRLNGYKLLIAKDVFIYHKGQASFKTKSAQETKSLVQESTDRLAEKLIKHYGFGNVPPPEELWGIDWFRPSEKYKDMFRKVDKKVSIVILNYKRADDTIECLNSIYDNDYERFQVIVIDNNSQDGSLEKIAEYANRKGINIINGELKEGFKKELILISNGENIGFAAGNNIGIRYALENGAEYVWLLNNDTVIEKKSLSELINSSLIDKKIGLVSSKIYFYETRDMVQYDGFIPSDEGRKDRKEDSIRIVDFAPACSLLIKKEVFQDIGYLDEKYFLYFEDNDFCKRAKNAGWIILYNPNSKIYHKGGASIGKWLKTPVSSYYAPRNFLYCNADPHNISQCFRHLEEIYWPQLDKSPECIKGFVEGIKDFILGKNGKVSENQLNPKSWINWSDEKLKDTACELINNPDESCLLKFLSLAQAILLKKQNIVVSAEQEAKSYCIKGEKLFEKGQIEKSISFFEKAIELDPSCAQAYNNLAAVYWQMQDIEKAVHYIKKAIKLAPSDPDVLWNYKEIMRMLGLHKEDQKTSN